jgi:hypothetical protein
MRSRRIITELSASGTAFGVWRITAAYANDGGTVAVLDAVTAEAGTGNTVVDVNPPSAKVNGAVVEITVTGSAVCKWRITRHIDEST